LRIELRRQKEGLATAAECVEDQGNFGSVPTSLPMSRVIRTYRLLGVTLHLERKAVRRRSVGALLHNRTYGYPVRQFGAVIGNHPCFYKPPFHFWDGIGVDSSRRALSFHAPKCSTRLLEL
jgi:hypothetical protein